MRLAVVPLPREKVIVVRIVKTPGTSRKLRAAAAIEAVLRLWSRD
jgi:hypothetical protein